MTVAVVFQKVRWKNFLSTGNSFTEISLNQNKTTLIMGINASGKSTILDAIVFACYGKPFRNINKPALVNSINLKDCLVELELQSGTSQYLIRRGIKPTVFEIYKDDVLLNQDAANKDYQKHFEDNVLGMNYKAFTQIVILGKASYVPFMQLTQADRRAVVEDFLDIQIFGVMNTIVKQDLVTNKSAIEKNSLELRSSQEKLIILQNTLRGLESTSYARMQEVQNQIDELNLKIIDLKAKIFLLREEKDALSSVITSRMGPLQKKLSQFSKFQTQITTNKNRIKKELQFFHDSGESCPTCHQDIDSNFRHSQIETLTSKSTEQEKALLELNRLISQTTEESKKIEDLSLQLTEKDSEIKVSNTNISTYTSHLNTLHSQMQSLSESDKITLDTQEALEEEKNRQQMRLQDKENLVSDYTLFETSLGLLKDSGIKSQIIRKYIPIINRVANAYLSQMGFFVQFEMDETFKETIKSRHRDDFSYASFSEGEKLRIDMALMLTWRYIAKMKASVSTNLLILDEIFDGSMDNSGMEALLTIFRSLGDSTNIFVISHRGDAILDKFDTTVRFNKPKSFSVIV